MTKSNIIALHGFLGSPKDFSPYRSFSLRAPAIFQMPPGPSDAWIARFNRLCPDDNVLLGYSMGGRIALRALFAAPEKYRAAIILAAHPGLRSARERAARREADLLWARKFHAMPWAKLMAEWNNQAVLKTSKPRTLHESDFCRRTLARYLRYFSLGEQAYLIDEINRLNMPILWLAAKSESAAIHGLTLKNPHSRLLFMEKGGHRFVFEQSHMVAHHIETFLASLPPRNCSLRRE